MIKDPSRHETPQEGEYSEDLSVAHGRNWGIRKDNGQMGTEVEIRLQLSHNALTTAEEYLK